MRLWSRVVVSSLVLALAFNLSLGTADAASKKKKKKEAPKKVERYEETRPRKEVISGANMGARPGYFFSDTAETLNKNQFMGALHLTFDTWGSTLNIPFGGSYGITDKLLVNFNTSFYSFGGYTYAFGPYTTTGVGGASGLNSINFGGKYGFGRVAKGLDMAAGLNMSIGPISSALGSSVFGFDPYGVATWTLPSGVQLNGRLGLFFTSYSQTYLNPVYYNGGPFPRYITASVGVTYFQLDLGAAFPFDRNLTGIAELATNGVYGAFGAGGGTPLVFGIRTGKDVQLQALAGLDLGGIVGLFIGGGVVLVSK